MKKIEKELLTTNSIATTMLDMAKLGKLKNEQKILELEKQNRDFQQIIDIAQPRVKKAKPIIQKIINKYNIKDTTIGVSNADISGQANMNKDNQKANNVQVGNDATFN